MKRFIAAILSAAMLFGCTSKSSTDNANDTPDAAESTKIVFENDDDAIEFDKLNDPELLGYVEDKV